MNIGRLAARLRRPALALFRYSDVPGMVGRVGTCFGRHGAVLEEIVGSDGFLAGRAVSLGG
jgi:hypothetical protein